jgi:hypothetical protein
VVRKAHRAKYFLPSAGGSGWNSEPRNTPDCRLSVARGSLPRVPPDPLRLRRRDLQDRRAANRQSPRKRVPIPITSNQKSHGLIYVNAKLSVDIMFQ